MMPYFLILVVLAALTGCRVHGLGLGDIFSKCSYMDTCVTGDTIVFYRQDKCASFDKLKQCVEEYRPDCESSSVFKGFAAKVKTLESTCGGGVGMVSSIWATVTVVIVAMFM